MANIEDTDPWLVAGAGLVADLKWATAEREGRVFVEEPGVYVVGEDGSREFVGSAGDVQESLEEEFATAYQAAYDDALRDGDYA